MVLLDHWIDFSCLENKILLKPTLGGVDTAIFLEMLAFYHTQRIYIL